MILLDRYVLRMLLLNYVIALSVLLSLYVALDLLVNIDEFTEQSASAAQMLRNLCGYYGASVFLYFAQISGIITLFACLVTLARMRRLNELSAMASSGVSLHRVTSVVFVFATATTLLWVVDTEWVIPSIAHQLARRRDDPSGQRSFGVWFLPDREGGLLCAQEFTPNSRKLRRLLVLHRDEQGEFDQYIEADEAEWKAVAGHPLGGYWRLLRGLIRTRTSGGAAVGPSEDMPPEPIATYPSALDPDAIQLRQSAEWLRYLSSQQLSQLAARSPANAAEIQQVKQTRFTTPFISLIMLLLGVPFFLSRTPGNVLGDGAKSLVVCGLCFLVSFACQHLAHGSGTAALPWTAWLPILLFAPAAAVMLDRVKT